MRKILTVLIFVLPLLASVAGIREARAEGAAPSQAKGMESEAVINYCLNISDRAAEVRAARQAAALKGMEDRIKIKITELEKHRVALQAWVEQQKALRDSAEKSLVEIYAAMDPEVASKQMTELDPRLASSVLQQLKPRLASGILDEMKPDAAAKLIRYIAAAAQKEKAIK